jgi:hypothetical protein
MRLRMYLTISAIVIVIAGLGCGGNSTNSAASSVRGYNGTASVGDFLNISLDPLTRTLTYTNVSNGDHGTIPYTVNADSTYTLNDPAGNLVAAYEVPGYGMLIQATKTGPNHNTPALITAVQSGKISMSTWAGHQYNYMQFRTASGGMEVGSVSIDPQGNVANDSYWPYGATNNQGSPFNRGGFSIGSFTQDPSGTFMKVDEGNGSFDYVFGTPSGIFAVDTGNGAILGMKKAAVKDFDPSFAGTYHALYYQKTGASTGIGNVETGTPSLGKATMIIGASGNVTVQDAQGNVLVQATLTPIADAVYLHDGTANTLQDPCFGLFTFRVTVGNSQQDVFVSFLDRSILFSSFKTTLPANPGNTYDYLYGVGLK